MVDSRLAHLTAEQIDELIHRYYAGGETVAALVEEFGVNIRPSNLIGILPAEISDEVCIYCRGVHLERRRVSRTESSWRRGPAAACPNCGHSESDRCGCGNCSARRRQAEEYVRVAKRAAIQDIASVAARDIVVEDLSFLAALGVSSLSRHSMSADYGTVRPFSLEPLSWTPSLEMNNDWVIALYRSRYVAVSLSSPIDAFAFDEQITSVTEYWPSKVHWNFLPSMDAPARRILMQRLESVIQNGDWPDHWYGEADSIWRAVGREECLAHFRVLMEERDFEPNLRDERIIDVIERGLDHFSPAQIMNLLWQSARDAVDYIFKKDIPRRQTQDMCRSILDRKIDRSIAQNWDVKPARRDYRSAESAASATLFNAFLKLDGRALEHKVPLRSSVEGNN